MNPKITIAFTSVNERAMLEKTLPVWLQQDYPNLEIVVSDDFSHDGTEEYIKKNFPQIRYKRLGDERHGYGVNKNTAVSLASGEYVLLLDNDILPESRSYITNLFEAFLKLEDAALLGVGLYDAGAKKTKYYGIYYSLYGTKIHKNAVKLEKMTTHSGPIVVPSYHGGGVFFKKEIWEKLGGYDTIQPFMLDDTDVSARAYAAGYKVYLYNAELLEHIGMGNHDDKKYFSWKFTYYLSGILTVMVKNFPLKELFRIFFAALVYPFIYLSVAVKKRNFGIIVAYFKSIGIFLKNLPHMLKQRKIIQSMNKKKDASFLYIKEPF